MRSPSLCVQAVLVQYFCSFVGTVPLSLHQYLLCIAFGFVGMPIAALVKLIPVPETSWSAAVIASLCGEAEEEAASDAENNLQEPLLNNHPTPTE